MSLTEARPRRAVSGSQELCVASVPYSHVYVRHLAPVQGGRVRRMPDPDPVEPTRFTQQKWWPPVMLHPDWIAQHTFDVFHLHFGFDSWQPEDLAGVVSLVQDRGRPFVYTVHDLRNPHHHERALRDAQLDVLVPAADAVVTLTVGAAAEIERRWNREAIVIPHPHVVPLRMIEHLQRRPRNPPGRSFRVGVHVTNPLEVAVTLRLLPTLVRSVRELPGGVLQVNCHRDLLEPGGARYHPGLARYVRDAARAGSLDLRVHDVLTEAQLWRHLAALDASVLSESFRSHSGWLEACRDVGTTVIAPNRGYFAEQGPVLSYDLAEDDDEHPSLAEAVRSSWHHRRLGEMTALERRRQRADVASRHELLYRALLF